MAFLIEFANFPSDTLAIQTLFSEYAASLGIDLAFQSFENELNSLPGKYTAAQGGTLLVARAVKQDTTSDVAQTPQPGIVAQSNIPSLETSQTGSIVGCVALRRNDEHWCEMKRLYVKPDTRGARVGDKLVEAVIAEAKALGYLGMRLDTLPEMGAALHLYRRHGFVNIEPYYDTPLEGTIFMGCNLNKP